MTTVHALFEAQVRKSPDSLAVTSHGEHLSFAGLNRAANGLAAYLRRHGVGPDAHVGILIQPSLGMVVGIIAVLKAGGCYVPLDAAYPPARLRYVLDNSAVELLLTQSSLASSLPEEVVGGRQVIYLDEGLPRYAEENAGNVGCGTGSLNLSYVIYTSGSTGNPKGVMVTHQALVHYLTWAIDRYRIGEGWGAPVTTSFGFDATVTTLLAPLLAGRAVYLLQPLELEQLAALLADPAADYSLIKLTPAHLKALGRLQRIGAVGPSSHVSARVLVIGGESLAGETLSVWASQLPRTQFINEYGPTEATVGCCVHQVEAHDLRAPSVPIGKPIRHVTLHVIDPQLELTTAPSSGELYIGGECLARGYLNRPALTASRFLPDAWSGASGGRVYRTGDSVREVAPASLEFVGRLDDQVKIRGHRVELGEIEAVLRGLQGIDDVVVDVQTDATRGERLVAYVSPRSSRMDEPKRAEALRRELRARLPDYMIPNRFVWLDALPLTAHAKTDRVALTRMYSHARLHSR